MADRLKEIADQVKEYDRLINADTTLAYAQAANERLGEKRYTDEELEELKAKKTALLMEQRSIEDTSSMKENAASLAAYNSPADQPVVPTAPVQEVFPTTAGRLGTTSGKQIAEGLAKTFGTKK